jgi:hypothetical protein
MLFCLSKFESEGYVACDIPDEEGMNESHCHTSEAFTSFSAHGNAGRRSGFDGSVRYRSA